ncbi:MAG: tyrosine-type recombinase/integrase, partial [Rhodospirillaceae bacterium]|nr:tyrosine-type recombinase/integrase [Rhodospirillaceae bacterium]
ESQITASVGRGGVSASLTQKRTDKPLIDWLDRNEVQAILDAPDAATVAGLRDRAMLHLCYAAGLRVSELIGLTLDSLSGPQLEAIRVLGKGRRDRELPLWKETKAVLNEWLDVRPPVNNRYLFLNARGRAMSPDGFAYILSQHVVRAARTVPSLNEKRVTPHVIRHSTAMMILHATGDVRKVSLWLGHADLKSTEAYLRASPAEKLEILEINAPPSIRPGAFPGAKDSLMSLLGGK